MRSSISIAGANSRPVTGTMRFGTRKFDSHFPSLFSHFLEKGISIQWGIFTRLVPQSQKEAARWERARTNSAAANAANLGQSAPQYLRRLFLAARNHLRLRFASTAHLARTVCLACSEYWRYRELLPLPAGFQPSLPVGFTPLVGAPRLGAKIGSRRLLIKMTPSACPR